LVITKGYLVNRLTSRGSVATKVTGPGEVSSKFKYPALFYDVYGQRSLRQTFIYLRFLLANPVARREGSRLGKTSGVKDF